MTEIWKPVAGRPVMFEVSDQGSIRVPSRWIGKGKNRRELPARPLTLAEIASSTLDIDRLVRETFGAPAGAPAESVVPTESAALAAWRRARAKSKTSSPLPPVEPTHIKKRAPAPAPAQKKHDIADEWLDRTFETATPGQDRAVELTEPLVPAATPAPASEPDRHAGHEKKKKGGR